MASTGLSSLISNTGVQQTTLPSWYDTAQQQVVSQAQAANAAAPTPQNTVAQNAVNTLSGASNPFTTATGTLQSIASGAANPWNVSSTGQVTPNTNTALGGLFAAQDQQLQQLAPSIKAQQEGQNVASGNFGSLRGQTADVTALTNAQAQLASQQMNAALQNQSTGVQAGSAAGNVAQQDINNLLTTGQYQQSSPYTNAANLGNVLSGVAAPQTVSNTTNLSPLNQIMGLASALGGSGVTGSGLMSALFGTAASGNTAATSGILGSGGLSNLLSGLGSGSSGTTTTNDASGNSTVTLNDGGGSVSTSTPITDQYTSSTGGDTTAAVTQ
jgi:hypothetical protein